jgi:hypothetical protein
MLTHHPKGPEIAHKGTGTQTPDATPRKVYRIAEKWGQSQRKEPSGIVQIRYPQTYFPSAAICVHWAVNFDHSLLDAMG